ncbi:unnamed protein product [Tuber aestivum]|uniref:Uncharacterized protein n=1 Tax=Tuber aestivum TaxID=59557 RepID=A0A292Q4G0_9PEZI|nr:unnamed protein product [Tuber aestivum]
MCEYAFQEARKLNGRKILREVTVDGKVTMTIAMLLLIHWWGNQGAATALWRHRRELWYGAPTTSTGRVPTKIVSKPLAFPSTPSIADVKGPKARDGDGAWGGDIIAARELRTKVVNHAGPPAEVFPRLRSTSKFVSELRVSAAADY